MTDERIERVTTSEALETIRELIRSRDDAPDTVPPAIRVVIEQQLDSLERELAELRETANPDICLTCDKVHEEREIPNSASLKGGKNSVTWASPDDGHPYKPRRSWPDAWLTRLRALSHHDEVT